MSKQETTLLTNEQEKLADKAIKAFASEQSKSAEAMGNMSKHVLSLAVEAQKGDVTRERAMEIFDALCRHAERTFKASHLDAKNKEQPIKKLLPFWPVVKSQTLAGLKADLKISKYKSVYEVVKETPTAARKPQTDGKRDTKVTMPNELAPLWERLNAVLKEVVVNRKTLITATATALTELVEELEEMVHIDTQSATKGEAPTTGTVGMPGTKAA